MATASRRNNPLDPPVVRRRFWILACLIYMTLVYTTAIHFAFGPERTISLTFFTWPKDNNPILQEHFPDKGRWIDEDLRDIDARFLPTEVIGAMHSITGVPVPILFAIINCLLTLITAILFTQ
jgi:hypothetical protein